MVRQCDPISVCGGESCVTGTARSRLKAVRRATLDLKVHDRQWNIPSLAKPSAMAFPRVGIWAQTVMHVQAAELDAAAYDCLSQVVQQDYRIYAARQSDDYSLAGADMPIQAILDRGANQLSAPAL
jgi:hypothetical protein